MGQSASQPERRGDAGRPAGRSSSFRPSLRGVSVDGGQHEGLIARSQSQNQHRQPPRPLLHRSLEASRYGPSSYRPSSRELDDAGGERRQASRTTQMLQRTRSTFRGMLSRRGENRLQHRHLPHLPPGGILQRRMSYVRTGPSIDEPDGPPDEPQHRLPPIDLSSAFESDVFDPSDHHEPPGSSSSAGNHRPPIRFNSTRSDRPFRRFASLRRRRTAQSNPQTLNGSEDQATMLSRLLSVAAAATAATLMGDNHHAINEAQSLAGGTGIGDVGGSGEDGSFDGFLRALQNGRIASALRAGTDNERNAPEPGQASPLNFFRMFRFGTVGGLGSHNNNNNSSSSSSNNNNRNAPTAADAGDGGDNNNNNNNNNIRRMVPVIIVGIRSISTDTETAAGGVEPDLPPFIDALGNFPSPLPPQTLDPHGHETIDSILRPPQNSTSFRHRRRASMGGIGMSRNRLSDRMDDQRDHRSPDRHRERPWSVASSTSAVEPRPPPATPASPSPELSRISTSHSTPTPSRPASIIANGLRELGDDSRRNSIFHRSLTASPLTAHTEETGSVHSSRSSTNLLSSQEADFLRGGLQAHRRADPSPNVHYPRFASGHPRRNGVVEPDNLPQLSRVSTSDVTDASTSERRNSSDGHSWIIYVLGGSYPENHPILTTPSLFTENPTYEDMMLLSALLGPAKAPVASAEDVDSAGGVYTIEISEDAAAKTAHLVAVAVETVGDARDTILVEDGQRCLVCLCDLEPREVARVLVKCKHLFHKECIDQWLTQGRNSCPLCRGQGVDERDKSPIISEAATTAVVMEQEDELSASPAA